MMKMEFEGKTRTRLIETENVAQVERTLRDLADDFLGTKLYDSSGVPENVPLEKRAEIDLLAEGWLVKMVQDELALKRESHRKWLKIVSKEQLALMEEQGLSPTRKIDIASLFFVSGDYDVRKVYEGAGTGKEVFFNASERSLVSNINNNTIKRFGNRLTLNWFGVDQTGGELAQTCVSVMTRLFDNDLFDYGYCCPGEQYREKNMEGRLAEDDVDLDVSKHLQGFYWGNYFGSYLCDFIGRNKLANTPGCRSIKLSSGVLLVNELLPEHWRDTTFRANESAAMNHIGRYLFFEKGKAATGTLFTSTT